MCRRILLILVSFLLTLCCLLLVWVFLFAVDLAPQ